MPKKKVTPEIVEEMRRLRAEGLSYDKIARRLELNPMTVYNYLQKKRKRARTTPEIIERMVELRKRGFTYKEISKELGIARQTVAMHMQAKKMGGREKKVTEEVLEEMRDLRGGGSAQKGDSRKAGPVLRNRFQVPEGRRVLQVDKEEDGPEMVTNQSDIFDMCEHTISWGEV